MTKLYPTVVNLYPIKYSRPPCQEYDCVNSPIANWNNDSVVDHYIFGPTGEQEQQFFGKKLLI